MAATGTPTPNIGLRRPQGTDPASVDDINYNSNLIDTKLGAVGNTSVQEQINSLNSKTFPQVDNIDSFISVFQSDTAVYNVRIVSGTLSTLLYGNNNSGGCTGYRVGSEYIIYSVIDSDGLFYTGWVIIAQKTATFSRMGYKVVSFTKSVTVPDSGTVDIDIGAKTGGISPVGAIVKLTNNYQLPYFGPNNTHTYVELLNANILRIKNGVSGWGTATVYITLFFA